MVKTMPSCKVCSHEFTEGEEATVFDVVIVPLDGSPAKREKRYRCLGCSDRSSTHSPTKEPSR